MLGLTFRQTVLIAIRAVLSEIKKLKLKVKIFLNLSN